MSAHAFSPIIIAAAVALAWAGPVPALADPCSATISGFEEVGGLGTGQTGAILSSGTGTLSLKVHSDAIDYTLSYSGLAAGVTQAHIHFGKEHVAGGIMAFLCTNLGNGPAGTPTCPANSGTVSGTLTAASVVGPVPQNVTPGDFNALTTALDSDTAYVNIHTNTFQVGEIRGQIQHGNKHKNN